MIVFGICDDDPAFAESLSNEIEKYCKTKKIVGIGIETAPFFTSAQSVLDYIEQNVIDVLFLDIKMPSMSGFDLAKRLESIRPDTVIIFVSAYDEMVYKAFEYSPFRFLRKSHLSEELPETVDKVIEKLLAPKDVIEINSTDGFLIIRKSDIVYIESQKNYQIITTNRNEVFKCRGTMSHFETLLGSKEFLRVHSSFLVNLNFVKKCLSYGRIIMENGKTIVVSRNKQPVFNETYAAFLKKKQVKT